MEPLLLYFEVTPQWMWFRHLIRTPPGRLLLEVFWARPMVGRPGVDPAHAVETTFVIWLGNAFGLPHRNWKVLPERGLVLPWFICCYRNATLDKW